MTHEELRSAAVALLERSRGAQQLPLVIDDDAVIRRAATLASFANQVPESATSVSPTYGRANPVGGTEIGPAGSSIDHNNAGRPARIVDHKLRNDREDQLASPRGDRLSVAVARTAGPSSDRRAS